MDDIRKKSALLRELFLTYFKIGAFTFGGGYAMIALLEHEFIEKRNWISKEEFTDIVAVAESTPGPIAINCATYVGYKLCGFVGAVMATAAVCIPSVIIILLISLIYDSFLANPYVAAAFGGVRVCVVYLIGSVGIKMLKDMKKDLLSICIMTVVCATMIVTTLLAVKCSTILVILVCGIVGIVNYLLCDMKKEGTDDLS